MSRVDTLGSGTGQFDLGFDWKGEYVSSLAGGKEGMERFSQLSATPDTTELYAGPARFSAIATAGAAGLFPIGMAQSISLSSGVGVARLFEIGSNRSYFTRGKAAPTITMSRFLADQENIIAALLKNAATSDLFINADGTKAPGAQGGASTIMLNLDSEFTNVPFGLMMVMKTKGGNSASSVGNVLAAVYLECCMMEGYGFSLDATTPMIQEGISIQFDRVVPVAIT